jgi:hypoxia-inducible factor prolyl 4-hydroxylase
MTVLIFLNEPFQGGETAFPFANNKTFDKEALKAEGHKLNLAKHCHDAKLYVKPQKGKAIMWYNHYRDPKSGIMEYNNNNNNNNIDILYSVNIPKVQQRFTT